MSVTESRERFDVWSAQRLESEITLLAAHLAAAECRWLRMIAAFDRRQMWATWGCASAAHWLNWRCALAPGAAREKVRVARALDELPAVSAAFAIGELSYSKVRALTRVATTTNEQTLVDLARAMTASQLERTVRCYKSVTDTDTDTSTTTSAEEQYRQRRLHTWWNDDGTLTIRAKLPAAEGEMVLAALERAADILYHDAHRTPTPTTTDPGDDHPDDVPAGTPEHPGDEDEGRVQWERVPAGTPDDDDADSPRPHDGWAARQADALVALAETVVVDGLRPGSGPNRHTVIIHTTDTALTQPAGDSDHGDGGYLDHGTRIAHQTVRRLMCDASLTFVLHGPDGTPTNISAHAPTIPTALARAVKLRDGACVFPGCTRQSFVDLHHIHHRADGGQNTLTNLACLCRTHHRMIHQGGYTITATTAGHYQFHRPDGTALLTEPTSVPPGDRAVRQHNITHGIHPSLETLIPDWDGQRPDYPMIIDALLQDDGRIDYDPPDPRQHHQHPDGEAA